MKENRTLNLAQLKNNQPALIVSINTCAKTTKRLADLGLTPNTQIEILRKIKLDGPIEIKVRGSSLILGKGIVAKILVQIHE